MSWYTKKELKKPYKVFLQGPGIGNITPLDVVNVNNLSDEKKEEKQAKAIAYKNFQSLIWDRQQVGYILKASLDNEEWQRRLDVEKLNKEKEDEEHWWDK